jgi:SAM-dependent methyltransferase
MKNFIAEQLVCLTKGCNSKLEIASITNKDDDCVEGFLNCHKCEAYYPILDGVAVIVNDLATYASQRPKILGRWLVESKSRRMKDFLKQTAKHVRATAEDRYEMGGAWFAPYIAMHAHKSNVDKHFAKIVNQSFDAFYRNIADLILHKIPSKGLCLDIGCALGTTANMLAKQFDFVFGVDQSFSFVRESRKRHNAKNNEFLVANALQLPFEKKFDLIVSLNLIDLVDPKKLLTNVHSLLANRGHLVLADPYDFRDERGNPRKLYDAKSLRGMLSDIGFRIDRSTSVESFIPWVLRIHNRAYLVYFDDLIIALRSSR